MNELNEVKELIEDFEPTLSLLIEKAKATVERFIAKVEEFEDRLGI